MLRIRPKKVIIIQGRSFLCQLRRSQQHEVAFRSHATMLSRALTRNSDFEQTVRESSHSYPTRWHGIVMVQLEMGVPLKLA